MKRDKLFTIKVSPAELERWREVADRYNVTIADMIRALIDGAELQAPPPRPKHRPPPKVDPELIRQVARIGNNLNQIARRCNTGQRFDVLAELAEIERQLAELIELAKEGKLAH